MSDTKQMLQRARDQFEPPEDVMGSLIRRRERKRRNQRIGAVALATILALVSLVALTRAFHTAERPANEPTPRPPGIFSEVGGWITYGNRDGIWAVDPTRPGFPNSQIQLSPEEGTPLAWSSDGSKLLIVRTASDPQGPHRLIVLNADGTETYLTTIDVSTHGGFPTGGSFSPDGSQVIYSERSSIYVVDSRGGTPMRLFTTGRRWSPSCGCFFRHPWTFNPTYSPDGTQIAYADGIGDNSHQLRVINADGSDSRVLVDEQRGHTTHNLAWSPDGEQLVFGLGTDSGIYVVNADGSGLTLVIPDGTNPYWSPDGSHISYQPCSAYSDCSLQIADADGTHVVEFGYGGPGPWNPLVQPEPSVAEASVASEGSAQPPGIFSEVGGWIAYGAQLRTPTGVRAELRGDRQGIWAVDPTRPDDPKSQIQLSTERGTPLAWASDGSKLLVLRTNTTPRPPHQFFDGGNLFVLNADGTETRLTEGDAWITGGSFSPDGSKVVYATWGDSPQRIYVVASAGGTPLVLLTGESLDSPTYSPDGSKIAYFGGERLRVMNADGSDSRVLTHDVFGAEAYTRRLVWSPDGTRLAIDFFANIYTIEADGSDLTLVIPHGGNPNWSPDGSRIAYDLEDVSYLEIADADGKNTQEFGNAESGPWNPLVQPEPEVAEVPAASEGSTPASLLLPLAVVLTLVVGFVLARRRRKATPAA